jgi:tRNA (mo5U34)-methyltransferase
MGFRDWKNMRTTPPDGFSIGAFFKDIYTFQGWELFPGHRTNGKDVLRFLKMVGFPEDLSGKRVLDIAPWNGFFSFECARRGASEVVSLGPDDPEVTGYSKVKNLLEADMCRHVRGSVYNVKELVEGNFDIVLFLGLIYHLRYPLLGLDLLHDVTAGDSADGPDNGTIYVDAPIIDTYVPILELSGEKKGRTQLAWEILSNVPTLYFTKGTETGDPFNWFIPNRTGLVDMVDSSGFSPRSVVDIDPSWTAMSAVKRRRSFEVGLEGYNPGAQRFSPNNP